jgi:hypothetical protein
MTVLHLGVLDLPYADAQSFKEIRRKKPKQMPRGPITTGDVAEILEAKYGILQFFYARYGNEIRDEVLASFEKAIESVELGAPVTLDAFGEAAAKIEDRFRNFLSNREMDGLVIGVPTEAAKLGHSKRFKRSSKRRPPRPSFIDTGLYEGSFRAWADDE